MKLKELKEKNKGQLEKLLMELSAKKQELNFKIAVSQIKNIREIREVKKNIAQIKTLLKGREE